MRQINLDAGKVMEQLKSFDVDTLEDRFAYIEAQLGVFSDSTDTDAKMLGLRLKLDELTTDTCKAFKLVEAVETSFYTHVGQAFSELQTEVQKVKEAVSSRNSHDFPGASDVPAGAHDKDLGGLGGGVGGESASTPCTAAATFEARVKTIFE